MKTQWTEIRFTTSASGESFNISEGKTHDQALALTLKVTNIRPQCQVPPAQYLPSAGLAAAAGRANLRRLARLLLSVGVSSWPADSPVGRQLSLQL